MQNNTFLTNLEQKFHQLEPYLPGEGKLDLHHLQLQALQNALQVGLPHNRNETWKYAQLQPFTELEFETYLHPSEITPNLIKPYLTDEEKTNTLVFVNGFYSPALSSFEDNQGITLTSFRQLAKKQPRLLAELYENANHTQQFFHQLNCAFTTDGAFILICENCHCAPIIVYHVLLNPTEKTRMVNSQSHIFIEKNANVVLFEKTITLSNFPVWLNTQTFIKAHPSAKISYYRHTLNNQVYHFSHLTAFLNSCKMNLTDITLGGRYHRSENEIYLLDQHCEVEHYGLMIPSPNSHLDWVSHIHHQAPLCQSLLNVKSLVNNAGHSSFVGKIIVNNTAIKTISKMNNYHLLLGEKGLADSVPQFEILADDVQCTHGASVGKIDENILFYLQSRGIEKSHATLLFANAFIQDILGSIHNEFIYNDINKAVQHKMTSLLEEGLHEH